MEPIIFASFLKQKSDEKNRILITNDKLIVIYKGKLQAFYKSNILKLNLARKKLIVALVAGGIGTSLSMIATSMGWYDRELNLFITLLFFGIMYYGFVGKEALEVYEKGNTNIYLLNSQLEAVQKFIGFFNVNKLVHSVNTKQKIYHIATKTSWENQLYDLEYKHMSLDTEGFIHASIDSLLVETYQLHFQENEELLLLTILPEYLDSELKFELAPTRNAHFPHIFGSINKSSIQSVFYFSTSKELESLMQIH